MNGLTTKNIIMFIAGAVVGASTGIYVYKKVTDEANEERIQEELKSLKEFEARRRAKDRYEEDAEGSSDYIEECASTDENEDEEYCVEQKYSDIRYNTCFQEGRDDISKEPYIIPVDEFFDGNQTFDKVTLNYYEKDGALVDSDEELIHDVANTIGEDTLERFGDLSDDDDVVYVRNEKLSIDYEIIRVYNSYAQDVLGIEMGELSKRDRIRGCD